MRVLPAMVGVVASFACTSPVHAQVTPRVVMVAVNDDRGQPVPAATVIVNERARFTANSSGTVRLSLNDRAPVTLEARRIGFAASTLRLPAGGDTAVTIVVLPVAERLAPVVVNADRTIMSLEMHGFYDRLRSRERGTNNGYFIGPEEIQRRNPQRTTQMLEAMPSVRVVRHAARSTTTTGTWIVTGSGGCLMTVYVNGHRVAPPLNDRPASGMSQTFVDDLVSGTDLAGIEIYPRSSGAPEAYKALSRGCGVVLIWTR